MPATRHLCEAPHCAIRNRHTADCHQHAPGCTTRRCTPDCCPGCQQRAAADGLRLCPLDTDRLAADARRLATLHTDLELVLLRTGHAGTANGTPTGSPVPEQAVMDARDRIREVLVTIAALIVRERGVHPPTRSVWLVRRRPAGFVGPMPAQRRVYTDRRADALAGLIGQHREWLAAHRDAGRWAGMLRDVAGDGHMWALAYPSGSDRLYLGDCPLVVADADGGERVCGARLYQHADEALVACAGCGTADTIEQWRRWIVGDAAGVAHAYAIAAHLAQAWMRPVDPGTVRKWGQRTQTTGVAPLVEPVPGALPGADGVVPCRPVRDRRGRVLLSVDACVAYATQVWGPPVVRGRRAS